MLAGYMKLWFLLQLVNCKQWIDMEIDRQTPSGLDGAGFQIKNNNTTLNAPVGTRLTPRA